MTLSTSPSEASDYIDINPKINQKLKNVFETVFKLLETNPKLKENITESFKTVFNEVTSNPQKLDLLLSNIREKMNAELKGLYEARFGKGNLNARKEEAKEIISKYTHMSQFALLQSIEGTKTA